MEAKVAYSKVIADHGEITAENIPEILEEKRQIIMKSGFLEFIKPLEKDVGGLDKLKEWINQKKEGFDPEASKFGLKTPKGILLVGFPGCGKSLTALQTAKTWNFPLLRFDIGSIMEGLVGKSESNMRDALKVADALAPCVLWVDEMEKGLAGSDSSGRTDGGTTSRVLATFLTWMQEKTAPVFVLATSNDISKMPPELTRKGRFDEIFFVDLPNKSVREEILRIKITENPSESVDAIKNFDFKELVKISDGYTGAEIEEAVSRGMYAAYHRKSKRTLRHEDVESALLDTFAMYKTMREHIRKMRMRKGTMYRSADSGSSDPLPAAGKKEILPTLTPQEKRRTNPWAEESGD
jgi:SpoVK/Ycf46/Vps4 family AAA+-type ATPase